MENCAILMFVRTKTLEPVQGILLGLFIRLSSSPDAGSLVAFTG